MRSRTPVYILIVCVVAYAIAWAALEPKKTTVISQQNADVSAALNPLLPADQGIGKAPELSILFDNKKVSISDYKGKVVMLDFWATWCGPCRQSIPGVVALYEKYKDKGFQVIGPAMEHEMGDGVARMASTLGMKYPVGLPTAREPIQAYSAESLPTTVLIDKRGIVRWHQSGYLPGMEKTVEEYVQKLLAE